MFQQDYRHQFCSLISPPEAVCVVLNQDASPAPGLWSNICLSKTSHRVRFNSHLTCSLTFSLISISVRWAQTSSLLCVLSSCHNEDTHHIGCTVAQEEQITIKGEPRIWRLGFCQMGNLIRGHFMHRKYVSLLVREWFIWTVILGSCFRPQLIATGKEVYDKSLN